MLLAWAALPALALVASADEGPPLPPADAGPPLRPPLTVLRVTETARPRAVVTSTTPEGPPSTRELIVLVGGYASRDQPPAFDKFKTVAASGGYDVLEFGRDFGVYDSYGPVCENAARLRDAVRTKSVGYGAVHIVTHSMGGVVADCAFALGLSSSDGVTTYVAWASPHDGSHVARTVEGALSLSGPARDDTRDFAARFPFPSPDTAAMRDMARLRATAPPSGVTRLDLRLATDALVSSADARAPGVDSRVLLPVSPRDWEGHGGILENKEALDLTLATIQRKAVPADDRGIVLRAASDLISERISEQVGDVADAVLTGLCVVVVVGGFGAFVRRKLSRRMLWPPFFE